jgi:hypothetical protein
MAVQTVQTTGDIPKVLEPFYLGKGTPGTADYQQGLIERGIAQLFPSGQTGAQAFKNIYGDVFKAGLMGEGAVAPLTKSQIELGQRISGLDLPSQYATAAEAGQQAAAGLQGLQGLQVSGVAAPELTQYQMAGPTSITAPELTRFQMAAPMQVAGGQYAGPQMTAAQMGGPSQFSSEVMQQYMDPYMQGVVDIQQRKAVEAAQQAQLGQNLAAARQGTYGGARQALVQAQREAGLRTQLGDIQATGLQSAFQQAQQQFERDRAATMQSQLANLSNQQQAAVQNQAAALQAQGLTAQQAMQAALANQQAGLTASQQNLQAALGVQQLGAGQSLQAQQANQAAQQAAAQQNLQAALGVQQLGAGQSLEAQRANQAAELQAAQQRLAASQGLTGLAGTLGQLGTQQLAGELDITKTMGAYGDLQRAVQQQQLDAERQMLMNQAQYGQTQVGQLSNLLRGIPLSDTTQTSTTPAPSFASQLTGLGLTGLGLYNMLGQPPK